MKPLSLSLFLFLTAATTWSQVEFAPAGAEWHYRYLLSWTGTDAYAYARNEGDTLLDGRNCKQIRLTRYTRDPNIPSATEMHFFYQSADSIFEYMPAPAMQSNLIFRNNFVVGEIFDNQNYEPLRVTGIDTIFIDNRKVRRFELRDTFSGQRAVIIYDLFGPARSMFDPTFGGTVDSHEYYLRCYADPGFPQTRFGPFDCTTILNPETRSFSVALFPNPAEGFLLLHFEGYFPASTMQITIWDALGRLMSQETRPSANSNLEVSHLPAGVYILSVQIGNVRLREKFVKD